MGHFFYYFGLVISILIGLKNNLSYTIFNNFIPIVDEEVDTHFLKKYFNKSI